MRSSSSRSFRSAGALATALLVTSAFAARPILARARAEAPAPVGEPPYNVLFILVDQQNVHALGPYGNGFGGVNGSLTPNLDRLASEGALFENAICASPQCCPSRYSLITGRWPHNHGLRSNSIWEPRRETTFPTLARRAGYATATIGKHHFFWLLQPRPLVEDHGFDLVVDERDYRSFTIQNGPGPYHQVGNYWEMPGLPTGLKATGFTTNSNDHHPAGYWANEVMSFLEEHREEPFVCWYSMIGPHTPLLPTGDTGGVDWAHLYHPFGALDLPPNADKVATTTRLTVQQGAFAGVSPAQHREALAYYYGLVTQLDHNIGRVLDRLDELGLAQRTIVVYTADHGGMASEMGCWTKGTGSYDATTRVPLILRLPGVIPAGRVVAEVASGIDLFPTLAELTGVPMSEDERARVDGRSLVDLMCAVPPADWPEEAFAELGDTVGDRHRMVRTEWGKYAFDERGGGQEEYYNLEADPWECEDLISEPDPGPPRAVELRARLEAWWGNEAGHAPLYRRTGDETRRPGRMHDPLPADGETDVSRQVDPAWLTSTAAEVQRVHWGTDPANLPLFATLGAMESSFNPGSLDPSTTYYWRVDGANANGTRTGAVWSFTTRAAGPGGPGLATLLSPADGARAAPLASRLTWTVAADADTQDLHFGVENHLEPLATNLAGTVFTVDPGRLSAGVTYQWRVDSVNSEGTTEGDVWTFHTDPTGLPDRAGSPTPHHMATIRPIQPMAIEWAPGPRARSHDVWFGTTFPLDFQGNHPNPRFTPGPLTPGETYYWRIDEVNASGTIPGFTWRFTVHESEPGIPDQD